MKKSQIKNLDKTWSEAVKIVAKNRCEVSGAAGSTVCLNSCHIIGRRYRTTRWGAWILGVYDLCGFSASYKNHMEYDEHGPKEAYIREKVIGLERYERIRSLAVNSIADNQDYETIFRILKLIIKLKRCIREDEINDPKTDDV